MVASRRELVKCNFSLVNRRLPATVGFSDWLVAVIGSTRSIAVSRSSGIAGTGSIGLPVGN